MTHHRHLLLPSHVIDRLGHRIACDEATSTFTARYNLVRCASSFQRVVLQVPGFAAAVIAACLLLCYTGLPAWSIWTGLVLWVVKDILLFFWVWPSYCVPGAENDAMLGRIGYVVDWEGLNGTVKITGTLWRAAVFENEEPPATGIRIRVCGREGLTLFVRPEQCRRQSSP